MEYAAVQPGNIFLTTSALFSLAAQAGKYGMGMPVSLSNAQLDSLGTEQFVFKPLFRAPPQPIMMEPGASPTPLLALQEPHGTDPSVFPTQLVHRVPISTVLNASLSHNFVLPT